MDSVLFAKIQGSELATVASFKKLSGPKSSAIKGPKSTCWSACTEVTAHDYYVSSIVYVVNRKSLQGHSGVTYFDFHVDIKMLPSSVTVGDICLDVYLILLMVVSIPLQFLIKKHTY